MRLSLDGASVLSVSPSQISHHRHPIDLAALYQSRLDDGEEMVEQNGLLVLTIPVRPIRRGGLTLLIHSSHGKPVGPAKPDPALLKAIARAHGWLNQMMSGHAATFRDVAKTERIEERYVRRLIPLAFLPPTMLADALAGRQSASLTVDRIATNGLSLAWNVASA